MKIEDIYVLCPANHKTGGTELAHQLVKIYSDNSLNAKIAYIGVKDGVNPIHKEFEQYVDTWIKMEDILDKKGTVVILPETQVDSINRFKDSTVVFWWMSVDFFIDKCGFCGTARHFGLLRAINRLRFTRQIQDKTAWVRNADLHVYQSEYARLYIEKEKYGESLPLSDYINDIYINTINGNEKKEDIVLYNPKKGYRFTQKIINKYPQYKWIALENMTNIEVQNIMKKSKVYIDFGNHPGKDRFPREAAMSGCCILTGLRGAAGNDVDIPIPSKYKFAETNKNIDLIGQMIGKCLKNYELVNSDFEKYRSKIKTEKQVFYHEAMVVIEKIMAL